jgi:hypothetical protein
MQQALVDVAMFVAIAGAGAVAVFAAGVNVLVFALKRSRS